jgi:hypothetical protein
MNDETIRLISCQALRSAARAMFDDSGVELDLRSEPWVDQDSYDAGLVTGAKFLLKLADQIEAGVGR